MQLSDVRPSVCPSLSLQRRRSSFDTVRQCMFTVKVRGWTQTCYQCCQSEKKTVLVQFMNYEVPRCNYLKEYNNDEKAWSYFAFSPIYEHIKQKYQKTTVALT